MRSKISLLQMRPDDKLRERMYDNIDRVIVFDNEKLKIEWKLDIAFQLS